MLFKYKVINKEGKEERGQIEAISSSVAISTLQRRDLVVISVTPDEREGFWEKSIPFLSRVSIKDIVMMTRQASTLFNAQVSAIKIFSLLSDNAQNKTLKKILESVTEAIKGGSTISNAMSKHPDVFSNFFVNMIKAGEESGKLTDTFQYLADYLERAQAMSSKTKNALIYPIFVVLTFITVMILMLTSVIPQLSEILVESGQEIPFYTKVVIAISNFFVDYGLFILIFIVIGGLYLFRRSKTKGGKIFVDSLKLQLPFFGNLYHKIYISRLSDNLNVMLSAGIPIVRSLEISSEVVDNKIYERILQESIEDVKGGSSISDSFEKHEEMPKILTQMIRVGEETGSLGSILKTLARFYTREVNTTIDTLIGMIEPAMIIFLGLGVGVLLASVLIPIYNIASSI